MRTSQGVRTANRCPGVHIKGDGATNPPVSNEPRSAILQGVAAFEKGCFPRMSGSPVYLGKGIPFPLSKRNPVSK